MQLRWSQAASYRASQCLRIPRRRPELISPGCTVNFLPYTAIRDFRTSNHRRQDVVPLRKELKDVEKLGRLVKQHGHQSQESQSRDEIDGWELTVGIEIHAQLNALRKLFSESPTTPNLIPNSQLEPFDVALPGWQPVYQYACVIPALRAALALGCTIQSTSYFDRKHYIYHDQPSGYQITQYYHPYAKDGSVILSEADGLAKGERVEIGIKQVQMEQDTARTQEQDLETYLVDYNRAGQPLIEIISLPHIHSPRIAAAYVRKIQGILQSVDAATTGMELGGLRADVNVSVKRKDEVPGLHSYAGITGLGQRTEIKNLSTFKGIEDAIRAERDRQIDVLNSGGSIIGETRGWAVTKPHETRRLRGKEGEIDYRYMPDPDIPPLRIGEDLVEHLLQQLPPTPDRLCNMLVADYGLSRVDAFDLMNFDDGRRVLYLQEVVDHLIRYQHSDGRQPMLGKAAGNWILFELGALLSTSETSWTPDLVPAKELAEIIDSQSQQRITSTSAKQILRMIFNGDKRSVSKIIREEQLQFVPMSDPEYADLAERVIAENPDSVRDIQEGGKHNKLRFLVGQMMRLGERGRVQAVASEATLRNRLGIHEPS